MKGYLLKRCFSSQTSSPIQICIVGSGPAGFYVAQSLAKFLKYANIDIYEKMPVPFGLVRFGVAPDHPEVKNVINTFKKTIETNPLVRFVGNIALGRDISLKTLRHAYNIVILSYGSEQNRQLNIPGENLSNVLPARKFVGWYNGLPDDSQLKVNLDEPVVTIFGQGNVAIDVARILLTPVDKLKSTDITQHALDVLSTSKVKEVQLIGRRGPLQAAFTIKELREILRLENCCTQWNKTDFVGVSELVPNLARPKKRITELMLQSIQNEIKRNDSKLFKVMFCKSPLEFFGENKIEKICLGINKLEGNDFLNMKATLTNDREFLNSNLVVTSIGYKSIQVDPDIPFHHNLGIVENKFGKIDEGLFATGWLSTGPIGVILTTMSNAFSVGELICKEVFSKEMENKGGYEIIKNELIKKNIQVVSWKDWLKIDAFEQTEGKKVGKPREKLIDLKKMLEISS